MYNAEKLDVGDITRAKVGAVEAQQDIDKKLVELEAEFKELDALVDAMVATVAKNPPQVVPENDPLINKHVELRRLHFRIEQLKKARGFFTYSLAEIDEQYAKVGKQYKAYIDLMLQDTLTDESSTASRQAIQTQDTLRYRIARLLGLLYPDEKKDGGDYCGLHMTVRIEKKPGEFRFNDYQIETMSLYFDDYVREEEEEKVKA